MKQIIWVGTTLALVLVTGSTLAATPAKSGGSTSTSGATSSSGSASSSASSSSGGSTFSGGSASSAHSLSAGNFGLNVTVAEQDPQGNVPVNPLISGRYFISKDMAILGGFGFLSGGPSSNTTTTLKLMAGARSYLKAESFAPFIGGRFAYTSTSGTPSSNAWTINVEGGAEYFLAKQFSVEGQAEFGYLSTESGGAKATYFGTSTARLSVNFYF